MHALFHQTNFPPEILGAPVWCVAGLDDNGDTKIPVNPYTRKRAAVDDPNTWGTFEDACATAVEMGLFLADSTCPAVGHVLRVTDGIFVIDFDKAYKSAQVWDIQKQVLEMFESYVEESQSGNGMHLYARGLLYKGKRFKSGQFEMYGHARFIVATGRTVYDRPAIDHSLTMAHFIADHAPAETQFTFDKESPYNHFAIDKLLSNTFVREAFFTPGGWRDWGIPDHSVADHAFMKEILKACPNHSQALEIFGGSPMGQRDKWRDRLEYRVSTLENAALELEGNVREENRLAMCFSATLATKETDIVPDVALYIEESRQQAQAVYVQQKEVFKNYLPEWQAVRVPMSRIYMGITEPLPVAQELLTLPVYHSNYETFTAPEWETFQVNQSNDYLKHVPLPGFLGELAHAIARHQHRYSIKMAEVVALSIAQMLVGKGALVRGTGLNLFLSVVGSSGIGKTVAKDLTSDLAMKVQDRYELPDTAINDLPKSKEGLYTAIKDSPSNEILINLDESHIFLKDMQQVNKGVGITAGTGTLLTDLYSKSDRRGRLLARAASKAENSSSTIVRPFVGLLMYGLHEETLEALNSNLLKNGFAARLLVMHVRDDEVSETLNRNQHREQGYSQEIMHRLGVIARFFDRFNSQEVEPFEIEASESVWDKHANFSDWVHRQLTENKKHHFNRASVNALKLASLAAIFNDPKACVITEELYDWACRFVLGSLNYFETALSSGELGDSHSARRTAIINKLVHYYAKFPTIAHRRAQVEHMGLSPFIAEAGLVPVAWLTPQIQQLAAFKDERVSPARILADVLKTMDGEGVIDYYHQDHKGPFRYTAQTGVSTTVKAAVINARGLIERELKARRRKEADDANE